MIVKTRLPKLDSPIMAEEQADSRDSICGSELCERLYTYGKQLQCDRGHKVRDRVVRGFAPL
jgi:hypothetical protein